MKILLYNTYHNGDLFFNQSIVRTLCKKNPNHSFTVVCRYNSYIFSEIQNLTISHDVQEFISRESNLYFVIDNETIAINIWIGALFMNPAITNTTLPDLECNMSGYVKAFQSVLFHIHHELDIKIEVDEYDTMTYMPIIPKTDMSLFQDWYHNRDTTRTYVFYYNYLPKSGQYIPIQNHDVFVFELANIYPHHTFLIPTISPELEMKLHESDIKNVIDCYKQFGLHENITCDNLCALERILQVCDYSIHFDIGACFYYLNQSSITSKNTIIHVGKDSYYYDNMYTNYSDFLKHKWTFLQADDAAGVHLKLKDIL